MAYTVTATRGVAPASLNLNPLKIMHNAPKLYDPDAVLTIPTSSYISDSPLSSDDEDEFNLDMVTMNMGFEQAYSMYTKLQKKNAMLSVDQLRRAQELKASKARTQQYINTQSFHDMSYQPPQNHRIPTSLLDSTSLSMPQVVDHLASINRSQPQVDLSKTSQMHTMDDVDVDQFFSNTESNALESFFDSLANGALSSDNKDSHIDPLDTWYAPRVDQQFYASNLSADDVKKEITHAFQHPPVSSLRSFGNVQVPATGDDSSIINTHQGMNLVQPNASYPVEFSKKLIDSELLGSLVTTSSSKRSFDFESSSSPEQSNKKNKLATKGLLSNEQKRLNHSLLEQKRRLLCREAYERCLKLVTNAEEYKREMTAGLGTKKKPSRKQLIKNGLPNMSKHTSLMKISDEISKLQEQNGRLRALVKGVMM